MLKGILLALLLTPLAGEALATGPDPLCRPFAELGCFYVPTSIEGVKPALLIYHRGWLNGQGQISAEKRVESSQQAFAFYKLEAAAAEAKSVVLVTGSSHVGVTLADVGDLERQVGQRFSRTILAGHSGGYVGLSKTLDAGVTPHGIIMLDNFYLSKDQSKKIQAAVFGGAACGGYYTQHNTEGLKENFEPVVKQCPIDYHEDYGHEGGVAKCLPSYLKQTRCQ